MNLLDPLLNTVESALAAQSVLALIFTMGLVYVGGLLTSLTPCVYPFIPITFSILSGVRAGADRRQSVRSVLIYGLGFSTAYVLLGMAAVASGSLFGAWMNTPWLKLALAAFFLLIGANTMGWVALPMFQFTAKRKLASATSVFLFGLITALSFSPCVLPLLSIVLSFAARTNLAVGALLLFVYAWGVNTIMLGLGLAGNRLRANLPKTGKWTRAIELGMALTCAGVAMWFVRDAVVLR